MFENEWQWYDMIHVTTEEISYLWRQDTMWRFEYTMDTAINMQKYTSINNTLT